MSGKDYIQEFLSSGKLYAYAVGSLNAEESRKVEELIKGSIEVRGAYDQIQEELATLGASYDTKLPAGLSKSILTIGQETQEEKSIPQIGSSSSNNFWRIAASILALTTIGSLYINFSNSAESSQASIAQQEKIDELTSKIDKLSQVQDSMQTELAWYANYSTEKYVLKTTTKAHPIQVVAYSNLEKSVAQIVNRPELDKDHDYQLWADVEGEMISLAVLDRNENKFELDQNILNQAESLNITIEPRGGNDHATVENLVASVLIEP